MSDMPGMTHWECSGCGALSSKLGTGRWDELDLKHCEICNCQAHEPYTKIVHEGERPMSNNSMLSSHIFITVRCAAMSAEARLTDIWNEADTLMKNAPDDLDASEEILGKSAFRQMILTVGAIRALREMEVGIETMLRSSGYVERDEAMDILKKEQDDGPVSDDGDDGAAGTASGPGHGGQASEPATPSEAVPNQNSDS